MVVKDDRIVFCLKLWLKELKQTKNPTSAINWVIATVENEILNGEYCSDEEFKDANR